MAVLKEVLEKLRSKARPDQLEGMARFGMAVEGRLGVSVPDMRKMAKELGHDHRLALKLWKAGIAEARILAAMIDEPEQVTEEQMEDWVKDFNSWDDTSAQRMGNSGQRGHALGPGGDQGKPEPSCRLARCRCPVQDTVAPHPTDRRSLPSTGYATI